LEPNGKNALKNYDWKKFTKKGGDMRQSVVYYLRTAHKRRAFYAKLRNFNALRR